MLGWHAGVSSWAGVNGLNSCTIGIELDNMGELTQSGGNHVSWFKAVVPPGEVLGAAHPFDGKPSFWHDFTEAQIERAIEVVSLLCQTYAIEDVLGHDEIAPGRKRDPGPAFPMRSFKARVLGRQEDTAARFRVVADSLNIRGGPGMAFSPVAPPLKQGSFLLVETHQPPWSKATVEADPSVSGWVSSSYITPV